ncbi:hypothetical protein CIG75_15425 [Tumebacillus algifaecis]|uniref:Uncharacterized protein n=1 Tax=Tumebacillus algifaecis TaxID=1214604 RepID=A0A223D438_9BACL|nr:hypothetical protein [Tumebacillus algifaecis]ASS76193.1 hypothetical protein CIG75_15425 [Tumebacillus algifaecis]
MTGKDSARDDKAVWLVREQSSGNVKLVDSVLLKEGFPEVIFREKVTPLELPQFPEERIGWYVTFSNDTTMILGFKSGEILTGK